MNPQLLLLLTSSLLWGLESPLVFAEGDSSRAKAVITDQFGNSIPLERESSKGLMVFSAKKSIHGNDPDSIKWTIFPKEYDARKYSPVPDEVCIGLEGDVTITVFLSVGKDNTVDQLVLNVKCGKGSTPPPGPSPDPKPQPIPDPPKPAPPSPTPKANHVKFVIVEDVLNRSPETSAILQDAAFWDGLKAKGHAYLRVAVNARNPRDFEYVQYAQSKYKFVTGTAILIIQDMDSDEVFKCVPLPKTTTEIKTLTNPYLVKALE